jgi:acetaldehyde dehydrogenase/alcohol dehydrogenase
VESVIYREYADTVLDKAVVAAQVFKSMDQAAVDHVVGEVFRAAYDARLELARLASQETGIGIFAHKVIKNIWASLLVYDNIRDQKTVGEIGRDPFRGITEIAQPRGPILALTPMTNPTSTIIFKVLIALKTRNPLIFSPHGAARKCSRAAVDVLLEAAVRAGAPENCLQFITKRHKDYLYHIMRHPDLALIVATGTRQIVKEAYGSGKPVIGIGPGNVPVFVHQTADLELAADSIVLSKTFDNGTVCASEQALVVEKKVAEKLRPLLERNGCFFCSAEQARSLGPVVFDSQNRLMRAEVVGQPAQVLAEMAGFSVPPEIGLLIAPCDGVGSGYPLSYEILTSLLTYYVVDSYEDALATCVRLNALGGQGHTVSVYTNSNQVIEDFTTHLSAGRLLVNTPATQGAIGGVYNSLNPSFTLSCGTEAGNIFTDNITTTHLLNIHRIARRRPNRRWESIPEDRWTDPALDSQAIQELYNKNY